MRHRVLGRTGLRVASIALGTSTFGTAWGYGSTPEEARAVYDAYRAAGGNFIDTADAYQAGEAETLLGDFITADRDAIVLATKFTMGAGAAKGLAGLGNSRRAIVQSVEASLKRLGTDRIDLLFVHWPDGATPVEEMVLGFDMLVRAGKVLYAGFSNFPAWRVAAAATAAEIRGWAPIAAIQVEYSLVERTPERELLPMAGGFGLAVLGWSPLGGGLLTGKYRRGETGRAQTFGRAVQGETDAQRASILDTVIAVAGETGATPGQVAIAWVVAKRVIPVVGPRTVAQLQDNLAAATIALSADQIARLDAVSAVPLGFPHELAANPDIRAGLAAGRPDQLESFRLPFV